MNDRLPTCKQLERDLSQKIRAFYNTEINFPPQKVTCKIFSKYLAIVLDEALTPVEKSLIARKKIELAKQIRREISLVLRPKLVRLIEEAVRVKAIAILTDTTYTSNKTGTLVVLSESPKVRSSKSLPKLTVSETN